MVAYAVARGRQPGIYETWEEAKSQVVGFSGNLYKKFNSYDEAEAFLHSNGLTSQDDSSDSEDGYQRRSSSSSSSGVGSDSDSWHSIIDQANQKEVFHRPLGEYFDPSLLDDGVMQHVYVDGGVRNNGRSNAVGGYGVYFGDHRNASVGFSNASCAATRPTNQVCELLALRHALSEIFAECHFSWSQAPLYTIYTDSEYAINCLLVWSNKWRQNGWVNAAGNPVVNKELIEQCLHLYLIMNSIYKTCGHTLRLEHVRGHSGIEGNEIADALANAAMDREENSYH